MNAPRTDAPRTLGANLLLTCLSLRGTRLLADGALRLVAIAGGG